MQEQYKFIGIDEGKQNLVSADTKSNKVHWITSLKDYPTARALQHLNNGTILVGYDKGYCEVAIESGEILHVCSRWEKITSAIRLKDGSTLLTGTDLEGMPGICVITLDKNDTVIKTVCREGDYVRLMSITSQDTFLLATNDHFCETDQELVVTKKLVPEGALHAWQALRFKDNRTLVSAGYGVFMAYFTADGKIEKKFGRKNDLPVEVNPNFYAGFQVDSDGNILVANWQGHGPDNGKKGEQLLIFSANGDYLKGWSFPDDISSLQGLLLI